MQYLLVIITIALLAIAHSAHAATSKRQLPASVLNIPATKAIQLPGIGRLVFVDEPIYPGSNFTWGEATKNGLRIPIDTTFNGENYPATKIVQNIIDFAHDLDDIRERFGNHPLLINSWYRTSAANRAAGGKPNSLHLIGLAADSRILNVNPRTVYNELSEDWPGGLGNDGAYTHVDARHKLGWDLARWTY
jgi:Peptidase M15